MILWGAEWCASCKNLKEFVGEHYPKVQYKDIEDERAKYLQINSVPALQVGPSFITGLTNIRMYLAKEVYP